MQFKKKKDTKELKKYLHKIHCIQVNSEYILWSKSSSGMGVEQNIH